MISGEILTGKAAVGLEGHGEAVRHRQLTRSTHGRRESEGAALAVHGHVQDRRARAGQVRCEVSGDRDDRRTVCDQGTHRRHQFGGCSAVGQGDDHVPLRHLAAVSVVAVGRIEEIRLRSRTLQRGGQLAADVP